jgi:hypothetical protein
MRAFVCHHSWSAKRSEKWNAVVTDIVQHEVWCEFFIESRSNLHVFVGKGKVGRFVSIPDWRTSCWINDPADLSFNKGKLGKLMRNTVDGTTVAYALQNIADLLP